MNMSSPITKLFGAIASSPFRVAPEVADGLQTEVAKRDITLEFSNDPKIKAQYVVSRAVIVLGVPFLEALWAAAHAYIVTFHEYQAAQKNGARYFALAALPRVANAYALYRELAVGIAKKTHVPWPSADIRPIRYPYEHSDGYAANELFLVAIAWLMHHEIGHARLDHRDEEFSVASKLEESDADALATRWVCAGEVDPLPLHKRSMGMVTAVVFLLALDLHVGQLTSNTHPPSFERLMRNLEATGLGENEMIYAYAFVLVDIHIAAAGIEGDIERNGSFRDMCASACLLLHEAAQNGG